MHPRQRTKRIDTFPQSAFKILLLNCNGPRGKIVEIVSFMHVNNIPIAATQETKFTSDCALSTSSDYRDNGGGLAFIIHRDINYRLINPPQSSTPGPFLQVMAISICT